MSITKISVIIPSLDGSRKGNVLKLMEDISNQTTQPLNIHIVKGISPAGKARNEGVKLAKGDFLIFLDDDIRLGHNRIIENMIRPFYNDEKIAITGASIQIPQNSNWFQRVSAKQIKRTQFPILNEMVESDMATTACCAIPRRIFANLGGFNDILPVGEDPELRQRVRQAGYKIVIVPDSWFYHPLPYTFSQLLKKSFLGGRSSAFGWRVCPELMVETPKNHIGKTVKTHPFGIRILFFILRFIRGIITLRWIQVSSIIAYLIGFTSELINPHPSIKSKK